MPRDHTPADTPDLNARIRGRDPEAIRAVVERYADQIFRAARGAGLSRPEAEDVSQATFMTFVERAERFEGRSHVRTWLFGILFRKLAEMRRHLSREGQMDDIEAVIEQRFNVDGSWSHPPMSADGPTIGREIRQEIGACLRGFSLQQRMAFLLREVEGLTTREIRDILGVTETNVGVLLFRARNRLRECLEAKGFTR
jgi:RNA polymerase sigma-70 factor (ECF subfamily)